MRIRHVIWRMLAMLALFGTTGVTAQTGTGGLPTSGYLATFKVGNEFFRANVTNPTAMNDALLVWRGKSSKHIPVGKLQCSAVNWNPPWHWYQVPSSITFSQFAIELCDGLPSNVEGGCQSFGGGSYCPWIAVMAELRSCSASGCVLIPR